MKIMIGTLFCICLVAFVNAEHLEKERIVSGRSVNYPVKFIYIDKFNSWWPPSAIAQGLAVPGYAASTLPYNYVCLSFWTTSGAVDAALLWSNPLYFIGAGVFGNTKEEIQTTLKLNYTKAGVKLMISAFGATETPTSSRVNPKKYAQELAIFANNNKFDGVDIDWQDSPSFEAQDGSGEQWLITFTSTLRKYLNQNSIITHAPQAPYFTTNRNTYNYGAYLAVHEAVGEIIDFYNVQFYNQGTGTYDNAERLFNSSIARWAGSSLNEMIKSGIPASKIVLGKPATVGDGNNGWMSASDLDSAISHNYPYNGWKTGVMFWQYSSDTNGDMGNGATKFIKKAYKQENSQELLQ